MKVMGNLTLMIWMTGSVYPTFVFIRVTFPSFVRPYIFLTTLYVNKEQYAMELKGCVSHYEGLRTHVDWYFRPCTRLCPLYRILWFWSGRMTNWPYCSVYKTETVV